MNFKLPSIEKDGFKLRSGVESNKESPESFWIPSIEEIQKLEKGNLVKLVFEIQTIDENDNLNMDVERMWVIIIDIDGDMFTGLLDNKPLCTDEMHPGTKLNFNSEHIIDLNDIKVDLESDDFKKYLKTVKNLFNTENKV